MKERSLATWLIIACIMFATILACAAEEATPKEEHKQKVQVEKSGGLLIKSQRQEKSKNSVQEVTINKSGGLIIIIQRNINKFKGEDLKTVTDLIPDKTE